MILSIKQIRAGDRVLRAIGAKVPPGYWDLSDEVKQQECNGVGSDNGALKCLVTPTTIMFPWMFPLSMAHDLWWGVFNDGTRETFLRSNQEFKENGYLYADYSFGWVWPKGLRDTFRNSRKFQARQARNILNLDACWEVFQQSARIDEGPEVQG